MIVAILGGNPEIDGKQNFSPNARNVFFNHLWLAWPPRQNVAVTKQKSVQIFGGEKLLEKCRGNIFNRPKRGYKLFGHVSDRFSDICSRFSNPLSYRINTSSGAALFCRRATLTYWGGRCAPELQLSERLPEQFRIDESSHEESSFAPPPPLL